MNTFNIKKTAIVLAVSASLLSQGAFAARSEGEQALVATGTFTTLTVAGAVAGGPVGFILGAFGGAFLAEQSKIANDADKMQEDAMNEIASLETQIAAHEKEIAQLERKAIEKLVFQVMFPTGEDTLTAEDIDRIALLAEYLEENPELTISLDGHADPRGTDEYNNVLAQERAKSVKKSLMFYGISENRINTYGHGSTFSQAKPGDVDAYAIDRRVDIEISNEKKQQPVVTTH